MVNISQKDFDKEYHRLNPAQKQAVDAIDGPVMVIAGAGTGKTQTIAVRIANILKKTDTPPHSILCLTFTDNAAFNMRQRLLCLIGPTAYSVQIHTFHSFCNSVISSNPDKFIQADQKNIEEIDKLSIVGQILDKLPLNSPLKPRGAPLMYQKNIISSIQTLKREGFSPGSFKKLLKSHQSFIKANQDLYQKLKALRSSKSLEEDLLLILKNILENPFTSNYFKNLFSQKYKLYQNGGYSFGKAKNPTINFKNDLLSVFEKITKNLDKQIQLQRVYLLYQSKLKKSNLYDFDDMINFVVKKFKTDPDFLRLYQEQIHYILVDEFQDSNNSQIKLLNLLSSYFHKPNLFVVGDDNQSIFRFQGASIENIISFYNKYQPNTFVLVNNYRSHQLILDSSQSLISNNQNKISDLIKNIDKHLLSQVDYDPDPINLFQTDSALKEASVVVDKITDLIRSGTSPAQIAVLYRQHSDVELISKLLTQKNIKFSQSKQNILKFPHLNYLIRIINAVSNPHDNLAIFSLLSLPIFNISPLVLLKILHKVRRQKITLADYVYGKKLKSTKIKKIINLISDCHIQSQNLPTDKLFVYILEKFSYLKYISQKSDSFLASRDLYSLFAYLKSFQLSNPQANLSMFVDRLNLLLENNLSIPTTSTPFNKDCLNLLTVHSAKGLEFEHVFIINCINGRWGNSSRSDRLALPPGIVKTISDDSNQEDRRLFYVALTRAKRQIYISFSDTNTAGRRESPSQFIFEIDPKHIETTTVETKIDQKLFNTILSSDKTDNFITDQNKQFLEDFLKNRYKFNISHLNSYLTCPHCFYYKTILKVPLAKSASLSFGTAIHVTLAYLYKNPQTNLEHLQTVFENILSNQFLDKSDHASLLKQGKTILNYYLQNHPNLKGDYRVEENFSSHNIYLDDIPLTGKIDKIEILPSQTKGLKDIIVTDFKTGKPDYASSKVAHKFDYKSGSYFRQMLFYKLLIDLSPKLNYHLKQAVVEYVEPDKSGRFVKKIIDITDQDVDSLKNLIKQTYRSILDLKFPINPTCKNRDHLHELI